MILFLMEVSGDQQDSGDEGSEAWYGGLWHVNDSVYKHFVQWKWYFEPNSLAQLHRSKLLEVTRSWNWSFYRTKTFFSTGVYSLEAPTTR